MIKLLKERIKMEEKNQPKMVYSLYITYKGNIDENKLTCNSLLTSLS